MKEAYFFLMSRSVKCVCHIWLKCFLLAVVLWLYVDMWFSLLSLQFSCGSWPMLVPCSMVSPFLFWVCLFWECSPIFKLMHCNILLSIVTCQNMALLKMCSFFRSHRSFQLASGLWKASGTSIWLVNAMMASGWGSCRGILSVYWSLQCQ